MSRDCQHGHLARSCELCERDATIARLRALLHRCRDVVSMEQLLDVLADVDVALDGGGEGT